MTRRTLDASPVTCLSIGVPTAGSASPPRIADYELLKLIGSGSYGDVWLARSVTGQYRAVKIVARDRFADPEPYEREFRGLKEFAAISLTESRQLALLHVGRDAAAGFFYYVMELADDVTTGREIVPESYVPNTLREVRDRQGRLPASEVVALGVEFARAVSGLHTRGLIHRDIKPSNIILVGGVPKLADVGLVAVANEARTFVGTEGYVPPEGPGTAAGDVYAIGRVLYELATGRDRRDFPALPANLGDLPDRRELLEVNEVILRACEPDARRRHADAGAVLDDLLLLQAGKSVRRLRSAERHLARALRVAAVLAIVALIAGTGAWIAQQRANREMALREKAEADRDALARRVVYAATLARAQRALETNDYGRARQFLQDLAPNQGEGDRRGFEWHALWREAQGDPAEVLRAAGPTINRIILAPDRSSVAVQDASSVVTLLEANGRVIRQIPDVLRLGGFSGDGQWLAGLARNQSLQRWRMLDGKPDTPFAPGKHRALATFGANAFGVFTDADDKTPNLVRAWDMGNRAELWRYELRGQGGLSPDYFRAAISSDARLVALVLINGRGATSTWELRVIDTRTGTPIYQEANIDRISAVAFNPAGTALAVARSTQREVALLDLPTRAWRWRQQVSRSQLDALNFSADGRTLAAGGFDGQLYLLNAAEGTRIGERRGQAAGITAITWEDSGQSVLAGGKGGDVRRWLLQRSPPRNEQGGFWTPSGGGRRICISGDGTLCAVTQDGRNVALLNTVEMEPLRLLTGVRIPVAFSADGKRLLVVTVENRVAWLDIGSGAFVGLTELRRDQVVASPGVSRDAQRLVLPDYGGGLTFADTSEHKIATRPQAHRDGAWWAAVSYDGAFTISGGVDVNVRLWRSGDGEMLATQLSDCAAGAIAPDNRHVALALRSGQLEVRTLPTLELVQTIRTVSARLNDVVFSPSGDRLYCGGTNGAVHVFTADDWREIATLHCQPGNQDETTIDRLAVSNDERVLAAYTNDGRIRVWRK